MQHITNSTRKYDLDWMRVLAFVILIFTHTGLTFTSPYWFITSNESSDLLRMAMKFPALWRIPLLFMISGAAVHFAMKKIPTKEFLKKRITRIFIPFLFVWLIFNPPVGYISGLFHGNDVANYFDFYVNLMSNLDFSRSNSSFWIHLWYLVYLLAYTFIAIPLFMYLLNKTNHEKINPVIDFISKKHNYLLLFIPPAIIHMALYPSWPRTNNLYADWDYLLFNFMFFLYGFIIYRYDSLLNSISKDRVINLVFGVGSTLLYLFLDTKFEFEDYSLLGSIVLLIKTFSATTWIFFLIGLANKYLSFNHKYLKYANEAVYPVFVMHILFQIIISYYIVQIKIDIYSQFLIIFLGTLAGSILFYELFIRHIGFMRALYGLGPKRNLPVKK